MHKFYNLSIEEIFQLLQQGKSLEKKELETLVNEELIDQKCANAFNINSANVREKIRERSLLFQSVITDYDKFSILLHLGLETKPLQFFHKSFHISI
ncbi:hypothetical protein [Okeania sp.]|uniref:hypothetical protein n=1 Tax=Okeania sp. TaxID=3100323 RepID=UPI002B4AC7C0|nr:hypothetical protein [Okeania sp.]MEB3339973.1 hypothetical protein [Okeania sp.]